MTAPAGGAGVENHGVITRNLRAFLRANRDVLRRLGQCLAVEEGDAEPAPVRVHVDMEGIGTVDDDVTTLYTDGFGGCIGVVLLGPGNTRTLAHIYSGHIPAARAASAPEWGRVGQFRQLAAAADVYHVYQQPSYWAPGDGGSCDEFLAYFRLDPTRTAFHGAPAVVEVGPTGEVTP
ncbi:hypothetical protein OG943_09650 [Amycolatopsis sp. NBC_00345]|uniref:hypothetical protein n=1 Tax=Amycolatopsis sp. NBC_00345 TaxID=2975955 RepID=UPI002E2747F8